MKRTFILLSAAFALGACGTPSSSNQGAAKTDTSVVDTTTNANTGDAEKESTKPAEATTKWTYDQKEDKMTSKTTYYASLTSDNQLQFDFPYDGGSSAEITIRKSNSGNEVMLSISKGQFMTDLDGTTVKIRFDQDKPITFECGEPSDSSSDLLFIHNAGKFIAKAKKSKKMIVQAEFYQSGVQTMEFTTAGLKWEH